MKSYNSYKDSGVEWISEVPNHWGVTKHKYNLSILSGFPFKSENFNPENGFPLIRIRDITSGLIETYYDGEFSEEYVVNSGDLLVGMDGDFNVRWWENSQGLLNQRCCSIKNSEKVSRRYLYYLLPQELKIINDLTYYTTVKHLSNDDIYNTKTILPPLNEQHQIVQYLDTKTSLIDTLIEKTQRKIDLLREKRISLINTVVTKGLNTDVEMKDSGIEWIGEIPKHWDIFLGSFIGKFSKGKGIKKDEVVESGNKCIRYGEIYTTYDLKFDETKSYITDETTKSTISVNKGILFLTGSGELSEEIGKCVVYIGEETVWVGGDIIVLSPNKNIDPLFLSYLVNSECIRIQREISSKGEIIVHIYSKNFKEMKYPIPPLGEQLHIVKYLEEQTQIIDTTIQKEQKRIELLKEYRQSLISEVVTGKIKVVNDD